MWVAVQSRGCLEAMRSQLSKGLFFPREGDQEVCRGWSCRDETDLGGVGEQASASSRVGQGTWVPWGTCRGVVLVALGEAGPHLTTYKVWTLSASEERGRVCRVSGRRGAHLL